MRRTLIISAALLALAACDRGGGGGADRQSAASQAQPPANITVTTPEGSAEVRTGGAAAALPGGLPAYPGASMVGAVAVSGASAQGSGQVVTFTTADPPAQVIAFYSQAVGAAGYRVAQQMNMGPTAMLTAERGEGEAITVTATGAGGATQVQVVAGHGRR